MTRLSSKTIINETLTDQDLLVDFDKQLFFGAIKGKGQFVIWEQAILCSCKSKESDHLNECKNCGGTGWIFVNPTKTKMILVGVAADDKYKEGALREWGMLDIGSVKVTALPTDKLSFMDKITAMDVTSEHQQILYPEILTSGTGESDSGDPFGQLYSLTKYDIKKVKFLGLFVDASQKLKKLEEFTDYSFIDNKIILDPKYSNVSNPCLTIRYVHNPVYHIMDIPRESMTSYADDGATKQVLPVNAVAKRAHLIKDVENFDGSRLFDNSWLTNSCSQSDISSFIRQLRYTDVQTLYNNLTPLQKQQLDILLDQSF